MDKFSPALDLLGKSCSFSRMKSFLSRPRIAISTVAVAAIIIGFIVVPSLGKAPVIDASLETTSTSSLATAGGAIQLSFQASGRVSAVKVAVGGAVTKGQILATLDTALAVSAVNQAKAALDLAKAQYASLDLQYQNAQTQQDTLVNNAYRILLSSGLSARPTSFIDEIHNPLITGTYTCAKEGSYTIDLYSSATVSNYSFNVHGLEEGTGKVTFGSPQPLGTCGLYITFVPGFSGSDTWTIDIPNTNSPSYQANKNAYDIAVTTRTQTLSQLSANLGQNTSVGNANVSAAAVNVAEAAYQSALAQYNNSIIAAPISGTVSFIDSSLQVGQSVLANQRVMTVTSK